MGVFDHRLLHWALRRMVVHDLRSAFRRVCWVGPVPALPDDLPIVLYANHHYYHDGHLLGLMVDGLLQRNLLLWMAEWERFPFFAPAGVMPFPPDEPRRRGMTIRRTVERFRRNPRSALVYFPEGRLHPPEEGVHPFEVDVLQRFDRILPEKRWWPVAVHVTWREEARPTALLSGGIPHARASGDEPQRLRHLLDRLRSTPPDAEMHTLVEGRKGPSERWDFSRAARWFERYL